MAVSGGSWRVDRRTMLLGVALGVGAVVLPGCTSSGAENLVNPEPLLLELVSTSFLEILDAIDPERTPLRVQSDLVEVISTYREIGSEAEELVLPQLHIGRSLSPSIDGEPPEISNNLSFRASRPVRGTAVAKIYGELIPVEGSELTGSWSVESLRSGLKNADTDSAQPSQLSVNVFTNPGYSAETGGERGIRVDARTGRLLSLSRRDRNFENLPLEPGESYEFYRSWNRVREDIVEAFDR